LCCINADAEPIRRVMQSYLHDYVLVKQ